MEAKLLLVMCIAGVVTFPEDTIKPPLLLSPYVAGNRLEEARNLSYVDPSLFVDVTSYSGFFTVDKEHNSNIFFWYFPVANRVVEDTPWIIWLQGGPGVSSLVGLFDEMGPFEYSSSEIKYRQTTWCKDYSMVFIDNPVGAGFSFTSDQDGYPRDMETCANHLFSVLKQLVTMFPELRRAPLYIAGSSYAGHYVPALAMKINEEESATAFNLQGLMLGNPVFDRDSIMDYSSAFYHWGIIDEQGLLLAKPLQDKYKQAIHNSESELALDLREQLLDKLQELSYQNDMYNILEDDDAGLQKFISFVTHDSIREAIHVGDLEFTFSSRNVHKSLAADFLVRVSPTVEALLEHYKLLVYCGQLDLMTPCVQNAEARRRTWHWSRREQFLRASRLPWWFNDSIAGYVKSGGGLTEVLVRGAGHVAPMEKPAEIHELVNNFIQGRFLNTPPGYRDKTVPEYQDIEAEGSSAAGLIVSVLLNVVLIISIVSMVFWFLSWKKKNDLVFIPLREDFFNTA